MQKQYKSKLLTKLSKASTRLELNENGELIMPPLKDIVVKTDKRQLKREDRKHVLAPDESSFLI